MVPGRGWRIAARSSAMQYALLGNTGLTVSRLAFGAMTFTAGNKDSRRRLQGGRGPGRRARRPRPGGRDQLLRYRRRLCRRRIGSDARRGAQAPPRAGRHRHQGGLSHRARPDARGSLPPAHPLVGRSEPQAPRHRLDRRLHRAPRRPLHPASKRRSRRSMPWCAPARCGISASPTGRPGRRPRRSRSRRRTDWRLSPTGRCTTPWWAATSSATSSR